jgi:xanthine dehydrogenase YagT iron-sulfur-binding subunit
MPDDGRLALSLTLNGEPRDLDILPSATLLDVIRDQLGLTGTKKGCDMGACGACTVLADGRRIKACLALAASYDGAAVTTIEGIGGPDGALHPLQAAFVRHDALQCGYCTPGQILSGIAVLAEGPRDVAAIREAMSGNLCRCGAHPNIVDAIAEVGGL